MSIKEKGKDMQNTGNSIFDRLKSIIKWVYYAACFILCFYIFVIYDFQTQLKLPAGINLKGGAVCFAFGLCCLLIGFVWNMVKVKIFKELGIVLFIMFCFCSLIYCGMAFIKTVISLFH